MDDYDDIIRLPHHRPQTRAPMPNLERAAQFAPFAALSGFGARIGEAARLTDSRPAVGEEEARQINDCLRFLLDISAPQAVRLTFFVPDKLKSGGAVYDFSGEVRRADPVARTLIFTDKTVIAFDDILYLAIV